MRAWHFTNRTLRDGRPIPPVGEWLTHDGPVGMCQSGLHASRKALDALQYAPGDIVHLVECEDIVEEQGDKFVCRRRKILASVDATEILRAFARRQALSVIHLWEAPDVVKRYMETGDESLRAAAWEAARAAAGDAVWGTARDAAWDAAGDAAWGTARDAAWHAAGGAARAAAGGTARDAAWHAAWDAANTDLEASLMAALGCVPEGE